MKPRSTGCCHGSHVELPTLTAKLRKESLKITGPRQAILEAMRHHPHPLLIKELHALLAEGDCDLVTVYRSMKTLQKMGMVRRVEFGKGGSRFELVTDEGREHHHHLVCTGCDTVQEIVSPSAERLMRVIARQAGYRLEGHLLEIQGRCARCLAADG